MTHPSARGPACRWSAAVILALALVGPTSCARRLDDVAPVQAPAPLVPRHGGRIVYGIDADPNGLDPVRSVFDAAGWEVAAQIYDTWAAFGADGVPRPYLAERIDHNAEFSEWIVTLRPNVTFHDGTKLDADAAVGSWHATMASVVAGQAARNLAVVEKIDDRTVRLTTRRPWASLIAVMTTQGGMAVPPTQIADPEGQVHPVGTGPFRLSSWVVGSGSFSLTRNNGYWRQGLPYLDALEFTVIPDGPTRVAALAGGSVDVVHTSEFAVQAKLRDLAASDANVVVDVDTRVPNHEVVVFNTAVPPFDDVRARRAAAQATDPRRLAETLGIPADNVSDLLFPAGSPWSVDAGYPPYDPAAARELVRQYEAEKGPLTFALSADAEDGDLQQALMEAWTGVGMKITGDVVDGHQMVLRGVVGLYQVGVTAFGGAPDPDLLYHFFTSETVRPVHEISINFTRLADPQIDAGLLAGRESGDLATRQAAYARMQRRMADILPFVWLYRIERMVAHRASVHGVASVTLPDGSPAMPFNDGGSRLVETWISG